MARSRETKIELTAYDDLFQTDESREEAKLSKIRDIPISEIDEFPDHGLELMMALFKIVQGMISTIMNAAGFGSAQQTVLPQEIVTAVEDCGFFESIPLWAVTLIGGLFITVLSFIMIMSVYGRFFKL